MTTLSTATQESYVSQGLALGARAAGVESLPRDKLAFEFAFKHAWRQFNYASTFPRIGHRDAADPYYALVKRSARRPRALLAAWKVETDLTPYIWHEGWELDESGEMLADWSEVPWAAWKSLGAELAAYLPGSRQDLTAPGREGTRGRPQDRQLSEPPDRETSRMAVE